MKKLILISAVLFAACGSPSTKDVKCDSTCVDSTHVDSTKVIDTLNTRGEVDTTILKSVK